MSLPTGDGSPKMLQLTPSFLQALGLFHSAHAAFDVSTDFAICKFLNVTPAQCHLITSGMMFGKKGRLLADLIGRSDHHSKNEILRTFNAARGNKRDVIAHGYIWSDATTVKFIERRHSGEYNAQEHKFTYTSFIKFLTDFNDSAAAFYNALGVSRAEIDAFAYAALSLERKSKRSPGRPTSKR
jgi:hypothetical protein